MKVNINGAEWRVWWRYKHGFHRGKYKNRLRLDTTCVICDPRGVYYLGKAKHNPLDIPTKEEGRKLSLARAVELLPLDMPIHEFYRSYDNRKAAFEVYTPAAEETKRPFVLEWFANLCKGAGSNA